jgi:hypothetical protein
LFKRLLKETFNNLPLILSDSTEPIYVSMNRIMIAIEFVLVILLSPPLLLLIFIKLPLFFDKALDIWTKMLAAFGVHLGINAFKKK